MRSETVVDEELVEMAMKWAKPCQVAVGPKGNYLGQRHTAVHCRKNYWNSRYFGANFPRSNSPAIPDRELIERIDDDLREILATHRPEPLSEPVRKEIRAILGRFEGA